MIVRHEISVKERRRRDRRFWRGGLLASVLFHLLLLFGWQGNPIPLSPFAAAGPRAGDDRAAGGALQTFNVRTPPPIPIVPPPIPIPVDVVIEQVEFDDLVELDPASILGDKPGLAEAPGLADGIGRGDGGNADAGLFRLQPPVPRGLIMPPTNRSLRGTEVQVWVFVDDRGRVVSDSTRLDPPTRDRDFNRRLIREASEWVFRPGVHEGEAVASWFLYKISM